MNGVVDEFGRALLTVHVGTGGNAEATEITAWVDTAFNGELVMPHSMIESAGVQQSAGIKALLADGKPVTLESFACVIGWFGEQRPVEVIANNGEFPLLGIGLLIGHRLTIDYTKLTVTNE